MAAPSAEPAGHWESVYRARRADEVSWYRPHLDRSVAWICAAAGQLGARILDVGAGAATLVDDLIAAGYTNIEVLDLSRAALEIVRRRLKDHAQGVRFTCGDILTHVLPAASVDIWHDRAVFHFLTAAPDRIAYRQQAQRAIKPGGCLLMGVFGPQGPVRCSGLAVVRYSAQSLHNELGAEFDLLDTLMEDHQTPSGSQQQFLYCLFRYVPGRLSRARGAAPQS